jgi:YD repeat-containing protein
MAIAPDNYIVLRSGKFDSANGAGTEGITREFVSLKAAPFPSLTTYFHGGLVSLSSGEAQANQLNTTFLSGKSSPLFVIWETGLLEVVGQNLPAIFNEAIFQRILRRVAQFVKGKLDKSLLPSATRAITPLQLVHEDQIQAEINIAQTGGVMFASTPVDQVAPNETLTPIEQAQIQNKIQNDIQLQIQAQQIANSRQDSTVVARGAAVQGSTVTLMDPAVLDDIAPAAPGAKGILSIATLALHIVKVVTRIIERFADHRDHGAYLTISEEILREFYIGNAGKFIWDGIKKEVDEAFGATSDCGGTSLVNQIGCWTTYTYDALGNLLTVTQNAQATGNHQTRTYAYDMLSRLTSEINPESGTTTYIYDSYSAGICGNHTSEPGHLMLTTFANGAQTCYVYDGLGRLRASEGSNGSIVTCRRFVYDGLSGRFFPAPGTITNAVGRLVEAETDSCNPYPPTQSITDEWFSYDADGHLTDFYQSTPHSSGYYHSVASYWANGALDALSVVRP